ncbi:MAG TPA: hypothetical protein VFW39_06865 [Sphingomicrobium sp.]|nr:hypothetical protein [Sphingomicrobium sp.]
MGSSVAAKANHYEVLGLTPSANESQIARAFADAMSMFRVRPVAALAEISSAYETLRNPAKRREYDRSIGIAPPPSPARQWAIAAPAVRWAPLTGARAFAPPPPAAPPAVQAEQPGEPEPASAIAASLREIARPAPLGPPVQRKRPQPDAAEPAIPPFLAEPRLDADDEQEERAFEWKKPALAVGGFVVAAGLIGTLAGLSVRDNAQSIGGERSVTSALPVAKQHATVSSAAVADSSDVETPTARNEAPAPKPRHAALRHPAPAWVEHSVPQAEEAATAAETLAEQTAADPLAPASAVSAPQPVAASMPLPNALVARTIDRIGYACGKVASADAVDGSPGVFRVTCTSGQSYQASPVHGRYHFRKLGGR